MSTSSFLINRFFHYFYSNTLTMGQRVVFFYSFSWHSSLHVGHRYFITSYITHITPTQNPKDNGFKNPFHFIALPLLCTCLLYMSFLHWLCIFWLFSHKAWWSWEVYRSQTKLSTRSSNFLGLIRNLLFKIGEYIYDSMILTIGHNFSFPFFPFYSCFLFHAGLKAMDYFQRASNYLRLTFTSLSPVILISCFSFLYSLTTLQKLMVLLIYLRKGFMKKWKIVKWQKLLLAMAAMVLKVW